VAFVEPVAQSLPAGELAAVSLLFEKLGPAAAASAQLVSGHRQLALNAAQVAHLKQRTAK
jgi:hypothetical protein